MECPNFDAVEIWHEIRALRTAAVGNTASLSLFGDHTDQHRLFAEHLTAECRVKTEGCSRTVDEWKLRPQRGDNHWFDGLVGCAVAASILGVVLAGTNSVRPTRVAIKLSEL